MPVKYGILIFVPYMICKISCWFQHWDHHQWMPVQCGILIFVPHLVCKNKFSCSSWNSAAGQQIWGGTWLCCKYHCYLCSPLVYQNLKLCSWFSAATADFRYQVWHKNPPPILDRHSLVVVPGLKSTIFCYSYVPWAEKMQGSGPTWATGPSELKFGIQPSTNLYFHWKKFQPWTITFISFQ